MPKKNLKSKEQIPNYRIFPSEFKSLGFFEENVAVTHLGNSGRMLGSKSGYQDRHPRNLVVFNANIIINNRKVWHGDIDLTLDHAALKELARITAKDNPLYVLYEGDARFQNEEKPVISNYVARYMVIKDEVVVDFSERDAKAPWVELSFTGCPRLLTPTAHKNKYPAYYLEIKKARAAYRKANPPKKDLQSDYIFLGTIKKEVLYGHEGKISKKNPIEVLGAALSKLLKKHGLKNEITGIYWHKKNDSIIKRRIENYLRKVYKLARKRAQREAAWSVFATPSGFINASWAKPLEIYLRRDSENGELCNTRLMEKE